MNARIRGQKISGYYGPDMGAGRWLFARSPKTNRTYSVARIAHGEIVEIDPEPAIHGFTNQELAQALFAAEKPEV